MEKVTGIIIQARMGSTRLPKKVIKRVGGKPVLEHVIERLQRVKKEKKIILATTDKKEDDVLEKVAKKCQISVFRGSENDVLDRFYQVAKLFSVDPIVRITADCPLIDPEVVENVIDFYLKGDYHYVSNSNPPTFPDGMDVEVFDFTSLENAWRGAKLSSEREHVTAYIYKNPNIFKVGNVIHKKDNSHIRITLDEKEDLTLIKKIYKALYNKNNLFGLKEIENLFEKNPELSKINQRFIRNEGYIKSLKKDKKNEK